MVRFIIIHEVGKSTKYDLTALDTPFGLLPELVKEALKKGPHGRETYHGHRWSQIYFPAWDSVTTYRTVPAPEEEPFRVDTADPEDLRRAQADAEAARAKLAKLREMLDD